MAKPKQTKLAKNRRFGRTILSALLLVLVLLQSVPLTEIFASGEMECCKGLGKMSADACAGGFCPTKKPKPKRKPIEKICGAKELSANQTLFASLQNLHFRHDNNSIFPDADTDDLGKQLDVSSLDNPAFSRSCKTNCCVSSSNYRNHRGFTNLSEYVSISQKPCPPTKYYENNFTQLFVTVLKTVHRECKPRAPPNIFS